MVELLEEDTDEAMTVEVAKHIMGFSPSEISDNSVKQLINLTSYILYQEDTLTLLQEGKSNY